MYKRFVKKITIAGIALNSKLVDVHDIDMQRQVEHHKCPFVYAVSYVCHEVNILYIENVTASMTKITTQEIEKSTLLELISSVIVLILLSFFSFLAVFLETIPGE